MNCVISLPIQAALVEPQHNHGEACVCCPHCGFEYVHPEQPFVEDSKDNYEASWPGRGDLTVIPFWCESGHKFEICFGFHKGNVTAFVRGGRPLPEKGPIKAEVSV